jgi:hypothetical protein
MSLSVYGVNELVTRKGKRQFVSDNICGPENFRKDHSSEVKETDTGLTITVKGDDPKKVKRQRHLFKAGKELGGNP